MDAKKILQDWSLERSYFDFEHRIYRNIATKGTLAEFVLIIDVPGYFMDAAQAEPIKLHHERVISIDPSNTSPQYLDDLKRDIDLFTSASHEEFLALLAQYNAQGALFQ